MTYYNGVSDFLEKEAEKEEKKKKLSKKQEAIKVYKEKMNNHMQMNYYSLLNEADTKDYLQELKGLYESKAPASFNDRRLNLFDAIDILYEKTKSGDIEVGEIFRTSADWRKKMRRFTNNLIDYMENTANSSSIYEEMDSDFLQGLLNSQFINEKTGEFNKDETIEQYQTLYTTINRLENLIYNNKQDYSSTSKTRKQLEELDEYKKEVNMQKGEGTMSSKPIEKEDAEKIQEFIWSKNNGNLRNAPETHIVTILSLQYGLRRSTITKLTINDIDAKNGVILVPASKNKGGVDYTALPLDDTGKNALKQIVQRSMEKNYNKLDKYGQIRIVCGKKTGHHDEFNERILAKLGLKDKYKGVGFHGCRRYYGQSQWDNLREGEFADDKRGCQYEVNWRLGHSAKELKNLDSYVQNMW